MKRISMIIVMLAFLPMIAGVSFAQVLFSENWETGVIDSGKWGLGGSPTPRIVSGGHNSDRALDHNGDSWCHSAAYTEQWFDTENGVIAEFWAKPYECVGCEWSTLYAGFTDSNMTDSTYCSDENYYDPLVTVQLQSKTEEIKYVIKGIGAIFTESYPDYDWHKYKIEITSDGHISFYRDDQLKATSATAIDLSAYSSTKFQFFGQAAYGPMLIDDILIKSSGPQFGPNSASLTNLYFTMEEGDKFVYSGYGDFKGFKRYFEAVGKEAIDGINCLKMVVKGSGNDPNPDQDPEWECYWLGQDKDGNIWALQIFHSFYGMRYLGRKSPILIAPKTARIGTRFADFDSSYREIVETNVTLNHTGMGPFYNCIRVKYVGDNGADIDYTYIAPYLFIVRDEWNDSGLTGINGWVLSSIMRNGKEVILSDEQVFCDTDFRPSKDGFDVANGDFYRSVLSQIGINRLWDEPGSCLAMCILAQLYFSQYKNGRTRYHLPQALDESHMTASALYLLMPDWSNDIFNWGLGLYELIEPIYKSDDLSAIIGAYQEIVHHRMPSVICLGGKGTSGKSWWHAVLAYKITYKEGLNDDLYKMYVYDPDFPWNDERFIAIRVQRAVPNNILIKYDPVEVFFTVPTEDILSAFPLIGGTILEILFED